MAKAISAFVAVITLGCLDLPLTTAQLGTGPTGCAVFKPQQLVQPTAAYRDIEQLAIVANTIGKAPR